MFVICTGKCWLHVSHVLACPDMTSTHIQKTWPGNLLEHTFLLCVGVSDLCVHMLVTCWGQVFIILCPAQQPSVLSHVVPHSSQFSEVLRHLFCLIVDQTLIHVSGHCVFSHVLWTPVWLSVLTHALTHLTWSRSVF